MQFADWRSEGSIPDEGRNVPCTTFLQELDLALQDLRVRLAYAYETSEYRGGPIDSKKDEAVDEGVSPPEPMAVAVERGDDEDSFKHCASAESEFHGLALSLDTETIAVALPGVQARSSELKIKSSRITTLSVHKTPTSRSRHAHGVRGFSTLPAWRAHGDCGLEELGMILAEEAHDLKGSDKDASSGEGMVREPNGWQFIAWLSLGLVLIAWDGFWTPMFLLDISESMGTYTIGWIARIYWTLDIPLSFMTGFLRPDGVIELRRELIWKRYALTWLGFDLIIVAADWIDQMVAQADNLTFLSAARVGKASRMARMMRILRVARILKVPVMFAPIAERVFSDFVMFIFLVVAVTLSLMFFSHLVACIFCNIGWYAEDGWIEVNGLKNATTEFKYVASLQWSISQLIGNSDIITHNIAERSYAVGIIVLYFLLSIYFVSSITTAMTRMQIIQSKEEVQFAVLRRYLRTGSVSKRLVSRIIQNAQYAIKLKQTNVQAEDVELLALLSEPLRMELHFDLHCTVITQHPLFEAYVRKRKGGMHKICYNCTKPVRVMKGDIIFSKGERQKHPSMFFVDHGKLTYAREDEADCDVTVGMWVGEMVLWTDWVHMGTLSAKEDCTLLQIDSAKFGKAAQLIFQSVDADHPKFYAAVYIAAMNALDFTLLSDLDEGLSEVWTPAYATQARRSSNKSNAGASPGSMRSVAFGNWL